MQTTRPTIPPAARPAPLPQPPPATSPPPPAPPPGPARYTLSNPIDPAQQTALAFGDRSHWLQPWRAYLATVPATTLVNAIGINFQHIKTAEAAATARLLAANGFTRARVEIGWGKIHYSDTNKLTNAAEIRTKLSALKENGIRPLILLNAHHGAPCPIRFFNANIVEAAPSGARQVRVDAATAGAIVPGRTGLNAFDRYKAADILFTAVTADGTATLSKPLPRDLAAGTYKAATLRFAPFARPLQEDGSPNPAFEETLAGWLDYVRVVTAEARTVLGSDDFDVEVWNELSFGSDFLYLGRYYDPVPSNVGQGDVHRAILDRTVAWLRDPANGVSNVAIGNGFANQRPWDAGSTSPPGLTAIDKHPYPPSRRFPQNSAFNGIRPIDARGHVAGDRGADGVWYDRFIPTYDSFFPEYFLSAIQTEHLIRDLSPFTTSVYGTLHGRSTHPLGSSPPTTWITEINVDPAGIGAMYPADGGVTAPPPLTRDDVKYLQAKATLRSLASFVNKGVSAIHFYAVNHKNFSLVDPEFFTALQKTGSYPGDDAGGETMSAVRRLVSALHGAVPLSQPRQLALLSVSDEHNHKQFEGDGTPGHPPLYNRDVLGFFPFQVNEKRFVVAAYVMTRNVTKLYRPDAPESDVTRYDLPPEKFQIEVGGLPGGNLVVTATDPLTGHSVPVDVVSRASDRVVLELPLTDSPRLVTLQL